VFPRPCLAHGSIDACLFTPTAAAILGLNHLMTRRWEQDIMLLDKLKLLYKAFIGKTNCSLIPTKKWQVCCMFNLKKKNHSCHKGTPFMTMDQSVSCFRRRSSGIIQHYIDIGTRSKLYFGLKPQSSLVWGKRIRASETYANEQMWMTWVNDMNNTSERWMCYVGYFTLVNIVYIWQMCCK